MPRPPRISISGGCYHVLNRGNGRAEVFHDDSDYEAFINLLDEACTRRRMRILAFCLMPNHFHLVLQTRGDDDLGPWMQWLMTAHVRRYHRVHGTSGHVWQGRYKSFPVQTDEHLYTVLRYVERNPVRAKIVSRAQNWAFSSLRWWKRKDRPGWLVDGPFDRPGDWVRRVNKPETERELNAMRDCIKRGIPYGKPAWQKRAASKLGLESTLRPRGRPRKPAKK